jgi:pro-kumamolisin-like protein/Big-like domain-containing protein
MKAFCSVSSKFVFAVVVAGMAASFTSILFAQVLSATKPAVAAPRPLITQPVDETLFTVLKGNTHPLARAEYDLGTAPATLPMQRMLLVLKRSAEQESALRKLLDDQQDKKSASYHKWLTPTQFGQQFGPTDSDIQTISSWLQSHGFQVGSTKGRTVLEFSGSAGQVQEAFHTPIHKYVVKGEQHWANATDPAIPTALTPAVAGVLTLHNFLKKPTIHLVTEPAPAQIVPGKRPQVTFPAQNGQPAVNALAPQDYAVIYNSPAFNGGASGVGITIGVVGRSNLFNGGQDLNDFGSVFACCGRFQIVLNGPDPGDLGGGEEAEATLDTTWTGGLAPGVIADLVVSANTNTADGTDLSEVYIVENNLADIMTESFSSCELYATDAQLAGTYAVAEQAAAQGITYFVSTGDDGAEGCDDPSTAPAVNPISVNMLASTPFNVAVGGTMFNENGQTSKYWGTETPVEESAISYIPENVWNESSSTNGLWSSSGGASAGNIQAGGTTPGIPKPSWQSGVVGIPSDRVRDVPDVALTAASHDPYLLCLEGSCEANSQGQFFIYFVSGTSASAPSFAGIMALVDQQMGGRQGLANYVLYRLAAAETAYPAQCNASNTTTPPASSCIFNDVTDGNNVVPGEVGSQYQATVGYDQTTGLGSVNIANLINQWNTATFSPTTTALGLTPVVNITHGSSVSVNVSVAPSSGTGTPTGDVSLLAAPNFSGQTSVGLFPLSGGTVVSATSQLPGGGPYNVTAHYAGDATYAPSDSTPVSVTVTPEASTTTLSVLSFDASGNQFNFTSGPFGSFVYLRADVAGVSGHGTPTGIVNFSDTFGAIPGGSSFPLNGGDQLNNGSNTATPNGVTFDTGSHTISASYAGDLSFNTSSSTPPITFTIQPGFFAAVPSSQSQVVVSAPGGSGSSSVAVTWSTGFSGTISLACSGLPSEAACAFSTPTITANGTLTTVTPGIIVSTTAATAMLQSPGRRHLGHWLAAGGFMLFSAVLIGIPRRRSPLLLLLLLGLIVMAPGCGGGSSNHTPPPPPPNPGTPAGTYNIVVTATSGSTTSSTGFTLILQ